MSLPNPEFKVYCVMCNHNSFAATADSLEELVQLVNLHIRQVKDRGYKAHQEYFDKHTGTREKMPSLELPDNTRAILASELFKWSIERLVPFDTIVKVAKIPPFPSLTITITSS